MKILRPHTTFFFLTIVLLSVLHGQTNSGVRSTGVRTITDAALGLSFTVTGAAVKTDGETYHIDLPRPERSSVQNAYAELSASSRPFIDLPGSYGGRMFLDTPDASSIIESRIFVDTLRTDAASYRREYWAVYAGMGMWDCVIRCAPTAPGVNGSLLLVLQTAAGKPGESVNGSPIQSEQVRASILSSLQDASSETVSAFTTLLLSVRFH